MKEVQMKLNDVIRYFGDEREAAYRLGYTEQALQHWKNNGVIPEKAQRLIQLVTKRKLLAEKAK